MRIELDARIVDEDGTVVRWIELRPPEDSVLEAAQRNNWKEKVQDQKLVAAVLTAQAAQKTAQVAAATDPSEANRKELALKNEELRIAEENLRAAPKVDNPTSKERFVFNAALAKLSTLLFDPIEVEQELHQKAQEQLQVEVAQRLTEEGAKAHAKMGVTVVTGD